MRGKILFVVGVGVGYVLGTRAGRERYEQIKRISSKVWEDPRVQQQVHNAEGFVRDKAPEVVDFIAESAKRVAGTVASAKKKSAAKKPAAKKPAAKKPAAKKPAATEKPTESTSDSSE